MTHWVMVVDLNCCIGCKACIVACSHANNIPEGMWRKLNERVDASLGRKRLQLTRGCMHCEDPPCYNVCPTGATFQRKDGIVEIDASRCVGCGYCILACPYDARTIHRHKHSFEIETALSITPGQTVEERRDGICTKCNFCADRIDNGLKNQLKPGVDPEATPFCVVNCSSGALHFGDLDDPESNVSQMLKKRSAFRLSAGIETHPSVYYLADWLE